jgi:hypothetical protein
MSDWKVKVITPFVDEDVVETNYVTWEDIMGGTVDAATEETCRDWIYMMERRARLDAFLRAEIARFAKEQKEWTYTTGETGSNMPTNK